MNRHRHLLFPFAIAAALGWLVWFPALRTGPGLATRSVMAVLVGIGVGCAFGIKSPLLADRIAIAIAGSFVPLIVIAVLLVVAYR
jgi:hypothetical protein